MIVVDIPEYINEYDDKINKTMRYKFIGRANNSNFLYENVKTGCKRCFNVRDIANMEDGEKLRTSKYERRDQFFKE